MAGHSMGASLLAAARIDYVKAVCCLAGRLSGVDSSSILRKSLLNEMEINGQVAFTSRGRDLKLSKIFFSDAGRFDLPDIISNLEAPMLIVHGITTTSFQWRRLIRPIIGILVDQNFE